MKNACMKEITEIKKYGGSLVLVLDRGAMRVYDLEEGSHVEVDYKYPEIIIRKVDIQEKKL